MNVIRLMVKNPVAVNILMAAVVIIGLWRGMTLTREFFPEAEIPIVLIQTPYPGATPEEVEKGVTAKIENAIESISGIDKILSRSYENVSVVIVELESDEDNRKVADDIQNEVDLIREFPDEAEETIVSAPEFQQPAISLVVYGSVDERKLKRVATSIKDDLLASDEISKIVMSGARAEEISIEVDPARLEAHNLTFEEVGRAVASNNVDLAGGEIDGRSGKIRIRTLGETNTGRQFEEIIVRSSTEGSSVFLREIADVDDTFEDVALRGLFQGRRAIQITAFKTADEDAIEISDHVKNYIRQKEAQFAGESIQIAYRNDLSRFIKQRIALLSKNGLIGLALVFIALALFLSLRMAFWVATGIVVSFAGTFIVMGATGTTINMITLFGLILVLGLIVDDAIIVAENIFERMERGYDPHLAATAGSEEVVLPVFAAVATSIVAFMPLFFIESVVGDLLSSLPLIVIAALGFSLIESFMILPSHLAEFTGAGKPIRTGKNWLSRAIQSYDRKRQYIFGEFLVEKYSWLLRLALRWRYVTVCVALFVAMGTLALFRAGFLPFVLFQTVDSETIVAEVEMATGTPAERTEEALRQIAKATEDIPEISSLYTVVGTRETDDVNIFADPETIGEVIVELVAAEDRERTSETIIDEWREMTGLVTGANKISFKGREGGPGGADISIEISGNRLENLNAANRMIRQTLASFRGVKDIEDDQTLGKLEARLGLKDSARALGLSEADLAAQMRGAFYGYEAQVLQRGDEEVKVWVRLGREDRQSLGDLLELRVKTPDGAFVPLGEVAEIHLERGVPAISRTNGRRTITLTADVDERIANSNEINNVLIGRFQDISEKYDGVSLRFTGAKQDTQESLAALQIGFPVALLLVYCLLAVLFKSYFQPFIVMAAIPFGIVGAFLGHVVFGVIPMLHDMLAGDLPVFQPMPVTFMSLIGIVGLTGIVVNDSLILVTFINNARRDEHDTLMHAVMEAGRRRFRPIVLTSITTVFGLGPLILEKSFQAQFLIPLGISISFGLTLATVVTLLLLPSFYMISEDIRKLAHWFWTGKWEEIELGGVVEMPTEGA